MPHYICQGDCKGVSEEQGVCKADDCLRKGMPLEECICADGNHGRDDYENPESEFER